MATPHVPGWVSPTRVNSDGRRLRALPVQLIPTDDGVLVRRGRVQVAIRGADSSEVVQAVFAAFDGDGADVEHFCQSFDPGARASIIALLDELVNRRLLVDADTKWGAEDGGESPVDVFYWHFGRSRSEVGQALSSKEIIVVGSNSIGHRIVESLENSGASRVALVDDPLLRNDSLEAGANRSSTLSVRGLTESEWAATVEPEDVACVIATSDFGGSEAMRPWNSFCLSRNLHFLPVVLQDLVGYVGPLVVPGETACFECARRRQNSHMESADIQRLAEYSAVQGRSVAGYHPAMPSIVADIAVIEVVKWYGAVLPFRHVGQLIEVNLLEPSLVTRAVWKVPRCPACSPHNTRPAVTTRISPLLPTE